ncbi:alpha/beta-hydrolase [Aspergillus steynii IBT 23096]|uniref:Alpha/beta-hydrolase n=1 Tax=Aspergillus steynii IBT 23096 TaxID=1392250 RepID=A0A2I2GDD2_9EURO|nr:alpha/beta-hydrolase [Aspergillus steynii IBT 23096]PLB50870.1 alpha/beta-hydrolase [Aspergillus steynii IBT 23096]
MATSKPAVIICHGSYHSPAPYEPLMEHLRSEGFEAYCPHRPTCNLKELNVGDVDNPDFNRGPPPEGFPSDTKDVDVVVQLLRELIGNGKYVLLMAHSSGGWVATQAAIPELQSKNRRAKGQAGGIIGLFYLGAFVIPVGESVHSFFQPKDGPPVTPPFMRFYEPGVSGVGTIVNAREYLFNDLDAESADRWAATLTASPVMTGVLTNDAYSVLPCAYLVLDNDRTLPKDYQEAMIALQTQSGNVFTVYHAPSGHSPHLSWTEHLVEKVKEFTEAITGISVSAIAKD